MSQVSGDKMKLLTLTLLAFLVSCKEEEFPLPGCNKAMEPLDGRPAFLVIGDSVSLGYTPFLKEAYPDTQVIHNSCNAMNTKNGVKKIKEWAGHAPRWEVCTINHGLWDINPKYRVGLNSYLKNLELEIETLKESCNRVIFVTTSNVDKSKGGNRNPQNVLIYNEAAKELMSSLNVETCDVYPRSVAEKSNLTDAVHYNRDGYQALAEEISLCIDN